MAYYLFPPQGGAEAISPSISRNGYHNRGAGTKDVKHGVFFDAHCPDVADSGPKNPTVIPEAIYARFHFAFLIRHPKHSIPSYYRCTVPPLKQQTRWDTILPSEIGYEELRRLFDYLRSTKLVGPEVADPHSGAGYDLVGNGNINTENVQNGTMAGHIPQAEICVIDADDLLDDPEGILQKFCASVGLTYDPSMLVWDSTEDRQEAAAAFEKWKGWHNDALESDSLRPRTNVSS